MITKYKIIVRYNSPQAVRVRRLVQADGCVFPHDLPHITEEFVIEPMHEFDERVREKFIEEIARIYEDLGYEVFSVKVVDFKIAH